MADHRAQVEDLLADYRRSREHLASVQHALAAVRESVTSEDGTVTATVSSAGVLTKLRITEAAYQRYTPKQLGKVIVRVTAAAAALAARSAGQVIAPALPAGTDPDVLLRGTADLTAAELRPPLRSDAEDSFENVTWMDRGGDAR